MRAIQFVHSTASYAALILGTPRPQNNKQQQQDREKGFLQLDV